MVESDVCEGLLAELAYGMGFFGADDVVVGLFLLEHKPHCADVVFGVSPVSFCFEVSEFELVFHSEFNQGDV